MKPTDDYYQTARQQAFFDTVRDQFSQKVQGLKSQKQSVIAAWFKKMIRYGKRTCQYCGASLSLDSVDDHHRPVVGLLIPFNLGGVQHHRNLVLLCKHCHGIQNGQDFLVQSKILAAKENGVQLMTKRLDAAQMALAHTLPDLRVSDATRSKRVALNHFQGRMCHPRFRILGNVFDSHGFLAYRPEEFPAKVLPFLKGLTRKHSWETVDAWSLVFVPRDQWHSIVFKLIERNGLVQRVELDGMSMAPPDSGPGYYANWFVLIPTHEWIRDFAKSHCYMQRMSSAIQQLNHAIVNHRVIADFMEVN